MRQLRHYPDSVQACGHATYRPAFIAASQRIKFGQVPFVACACILTANAATWEKATNKNSTAVFCAVVEACNPLGYATGIIKSLTVLAALKSRAKPDNRAKPKDWYEISA